MSIQCDLRIFPTPASGKLGLDRQTGTDDGQLVLIVPVYRSIIFFYKLRTAKVSYTVLRITRYRVANSDAKFFDYSH